MRRSGDERARRDRLKTVRMNVASTPPAISRVIVPPLWLLLALVVELALAHWLPRHHWLPPLARLAGVPFVLAGIGLALWAHGLFVRGGTGVRPFSESTKLVADGPYRLTRNPMYLGMTLLLVGVAILTGAITPLVVPPLFMLLLTLLFIRYEEAHMERAFGADYLAFKRKVRRWL
jgi:protein-S-isoprenylcysteine O-methyltransferase Ste14